MAMVENDVSRRLALEQLFLGYRVTQGIHVAARLGLADLLKDGPRTAEDLAQVTATHAPALYRILRLLAAVGVLSEGMDHAFALTPLGNYLKAEVPGSLRHLVLFYGEQAHQQVWGELLHSVQTGEPAYGHTFGQTMWEYHAQHPDLAALFNDFMTESIASLAPTVAAAYDFAAVDTLVDVGGGHGQTLASILQAYPALRGVLFDRPQVVQGASRLLAAAGVAKRCEVVGGDAFAGVPANGDVYLLSRVIHGCDDEQAADLLARCRQAMQPRGKVLLLERVIPADGTLEVLMLEADVNMLVATGGRERTETEYRALFSAAGLELTRLISVPPLHYLIEAVCA